MWLGSHRLPGLRMGGQKDRERSRDKSRQQGMKGDDYILRPIYHVSIQIPTHRPSRWTQKGWGPLNFRKPRSQFQATPKIHCHKKGSFSAKQWWSSPSACHGHPKSWTFTIEHLSATTWPQNSVQTQFQTTSEDSTGTGNYLVTTSLRVILVLFLFDKTFTKDPRASLFAFTNPKPKSRSASGSNPNTQIQPHEFPRCGGCPANPNRNLQCKIHNAIQLARSAVKRTPNALACQLPFSKTTINIFCQSHKKIQQFGENFHVTWPDFFAIAVDTSCSPSHCFRLPFLPIFRTRKIWVTDFTWCPKNNRNGHSKLKIFSEHTLQDMSWLLRKAGSCNSWCFDGCLLPFALDQMSITDRQTDRLTERETETETDIQTDRERETDR